TNSIPASTRSPSRSGRRASPARPSSPTSSTGRPCSSSATATTASSPRRTASSRRAASCSSRSPTPSSAEPVGVASALPMSLQDHLHRGEEILYRAHITRLVLAPLTALLAFVLAAAALTWFWGQNLAGAVIELAVAVVVGAVLGWKLLVLRANEFVLTNHRVLRNTGILNRQSMDSRLDKINNIEHRQTLWGRLVGFGDVEIDTASETG